MPALQAENIADLVADTLKDLGKPKYTDLSADLQSYTAMRELLRKNRAELQSGIGIQFNILTGTSDAARNVGINESDNVNLADGMIQASVNWRHTQTSYMMVHQLMSMNREPARIVDYVKQQRSMAMISLVKLMEQNFWKAPPASDGKTPYGLPYWVVKNATQGLNGTVLSGYSTVANVSPTTYAQWRNWTAPYTAVSRDDFIRKLRSAATYTDFTPPVDGIPQPGTGDTYGFFTTYSVIQQLEEALESQNDNLGSDIASMDGKVVFRGTKVTWVPYLETDTTGPFYGINWGWFKTYILSGEWLRETNIPIMPGQHNTHAQFIDMTYNFVCKNRRVNFVLSNGTTYPS